MIIIIIIVTIIIMVHSRELPAPNAGDRRTHRY